MTPAISLAVKSLVEAEDPVLVLVGPACRTWFVDRKAVEDVMVDLYAVRPYRVLHAGRLPFDGVVEETANAVGAYASLIGPDFEKRFTAEYTRDPYLAVGASLLVAFPVEEADGEKRYPVESADIGVVRAARANNVPILVVYRDGRIVMEEKQT
jgi:hypothetical protein